MSADATHEAAQKSDLQISRSHPVRRWLWRIVRILAIAYIGLIIVLGSLQTYFIFPGAATQGRRDAVVRPSEGAELVRLKASTGDEVVALFGRAMLPTAQPHPDAVQRPTILYFYGNGMCMADCVGEFMQLRRRGFNVIIPDYLGYGMSGGKPSEAGVYATADACYGYLESRGDIDRGRIVPMGWSLGAAAAIHLASTRSSPALITVSAFTSMNDMARRLFPYAPTSVILRHHFRNDQKIGTVGCPIFMAHGRRDSIIPFDMSKQLAAAAGGKVTKFDVIDGDHNDVFDVGGTEMGDAIAAFIESHTK